MFGILTVHQLEDGGSRTALRLRPSTGLCCGKALFRMAMFATVEVTLAPRWREPFRKKRISMGLKWLEEQGASQVVLPEEWAELAQSLSLVPIRPQLALEDCASQAVMAACRGLGLPIQSVCLEVYSGPVSHRAAMQLMTLSRWVGAVRLFCPDRQELALRLGQPEAALDLPWEGPVVALRLLGGEGPKGRFTVDLVGRQGEDPSWWVPQLVPPDGALARMPAGTDPGAFAAALLGCGAVQGREIRVLPLDIPEALPYNKVIPEEDAV